MKQNMKLQLCLKNKVSMTNQVSIRQATSVRHQIRRYKILKLSLDTNQIGFMFMFIVIDFF